ncbi:MAG: patatin-like protein [Proteobacteria bacterium]|nr:patatin-like protein [Pseudomonadota bacterium]MDA1057550.1 patatin-like protein [Pseudomonadota bacterium]
MKDIELRLALVCYGGVSLAVYMHGVTKEFLKLVRASRAYHALPKGAGRANAAYLTATHSADPEVDTEQVYFELFQAIGKTLDLRVVIDVITGASAGGVNGVLLARALAHDLSLSPLSDVWLEEADINQLLAKNRAAGTWSKWFLRPFISWYVRRTREADSEMREKLSRFLRSRWFRPPFDGAYLATVLYDAMLAMGEPAYPGASLLPAGQRLDLVVTLTDFYGYPRRVPMYDPPFVTEREHRHTLGFSYQRHHGGEEKSRFTAADVPSLAFAARATSSFPGAFQPAQIGEMDRICAARGDVWTTRENFLKENFGRYLQAGSDPGLTSFVDGSVLNNKPIAQAMDAIRGRSAHRQVDRRVVYVDPDPAHDPPPPDGRRPGWFSTLKGALSDLPRNEPVFDELSWVRSYNRRVRRIRAGVEAARPQVSEKVRQLGRRSLERVSKPRDLANLREAANAEAAREGGFAYEAYVRQKMQSVIDFVGGLLADLGGFQPESPEAVAVANLVEAWCLANDIAIADGPITLADNVLRRTPPPWVRFMLQFDLPFRSRRLLFVIRQLNITYARIETETDDGPLADDFNNLKGTLYDIAESMRHRTTAAFASTALIGAVRNAFGVDPAAASLSSLDSLIVDLALEIDLKHQNGRIDEVLSALPRSWKEVRADLLTAYIGFAYWDPLTFSSSNWREAEEYEEIRVHRISPEDADTIRKGGARATLKGIDFGHFGAFFSRKHRENDYLWGRLHAADRLVDLVLDAAAKQGAVLDDEATRIKKQLFEAILARETENLTTIPGVVSQIGKEVSQL